MWIPENVERAPVGPGLPGSNVRLDQAHVVCCNGRWSVTLGSRKRQGSPFLKALTKGDRRMFASGLNAVIMELSHCQCDRQRPDLPLGPWSCRISSMIGRWERG